MKSLHLLFAILPVIVFLGFGLLSYELQHPPRAIWISLELDPSSVNGVLCYVVYGTTKVICLSR